MLVLRALELLGKRIVTRPRRSRWAQTGLPWFQAHILWQADPTQIDAALTDAWTAIPLVVDAHGPAGVTVDELAAVLNRYVRDLVQMRMGHDVADLRYRLSAYLGVPS